MFLLGILDNRKNGVYFDDSNIKSSREYNNYTSNKSYLRNQNRRITNHPFYNFVIPGLKITLLKI